MKATKETIGAEGQGAGREGRSLHARHTEVLGGKAECRVVKAPATALDSLG